MIADFDPRLREASIEVTLHGGQVPACRADRDAVEQILSNLHLRRTHWRRANSHGLLGSWLRVQHTERDFIDASSLSTTNSHPGIRNCGHGVGSRRCRRPGRDGGVAFRAGSPRDPARRGEDRRRTLRGASKTGRGRARSRGKVQRGESQGLYRQVQQRTADQSK